MDCDINAPNDFDDDLSRAIALSLQESHGGKCQKRGSLIKNVGGPSTSKLSVIDPSWEVIDPNPNIRQLFIEFNKEYFYGRLDMVEVKWSPQMTLCAGICSYDGRGGLCSVRLSQPLLKFRPRKDTVETLLHEMIHAYLFVTHNNKDHDGHGPEFHKHMYRINAMSGANITVFHTFHDEVEMLRQHWWRCDGVCRDKRPFYGFIKRSKNRAPSKHDRWWYDHVAKCGGTFHKVKEPENYQKKQTKSSEEKAIEQAVGKKGMPISDHFQSQRNETTPKKLQKKQPSLDISADLLKKLQAKKKSNNVQQRVNSFKKARKTIGKTATKSSSPIVIVNGIIKNKKKVPVKQKSNPKVKSKIVTPPKKTKVKKKIAVYFSSDDEDDLIGTLDKFEASFSEPSAKPQASTTAPCNEPVQKLDSNKYKKMKHNIKQTSGNANNIKMKCPRRSCHDNLAKRIQKFCKKSSEPDVPSDNHDKFDQVLLKDLL